jgi:hypothetical protein
MENNQQDTSTLKITIELFNEINLINFKEQHRYLKDKILDQGIEGLNAQEFVIFNQYRKGVR